MTENKRFSIADGKSIVAIRDNGKIMNSRQVCDTLNDLNDKNLQLKMENNSLKLLVQNWEALDEEKDGQLDKQNQALKKLKNENEQLEIKIADLRYDNRNLKINYNTSIDENKQLKKEIKRLKYHLNETEKELQEYKDFMSLG